MDLRPRLDTHCRRLNVKQKCLTICILFKRTFRLKDLVTLERLFGLVDRDLYHHSGSVLYSGRSAFSRPSSIYIVGLNPGGSAIQQQQETIKKHMDDALQRQDWSAYQDESWQGKPPGTHGMQPRVLHLLRELRLDPRQVPASNLIFVRSGREKKLGKDKHTLLQICWPVHHAVIEGLNVRTVLCFGRTAGTWVRGKLAAHKLAGSYVEENSRRWKSSAHVNSDGRCVVTLTHPSTAKWDTPSTDPTDFVRKVLLR